MNTNQPSAANAIANARPTRTADPVTSAPFMIFLPAQPRQSTSMRP
jgi:hypothetical protein